MNVIVSLPTKPELTETSKARTPSFECEMGIDGFQQQAPAIVSDPEKTDGVENLAPQLASPSSPSSTSLDLNLHLLRHRTRICFRTTETASYIPLTLLSLVLSLTVAQHAILLLILIAHQMHQTLSLRKFSVAPGWTGCGTELLCFQQPQLFGGFEPVLAGG